MYSWCTIRQLTIIRIDNTVHQTFPIYPTVVRVALKRLCYKKVRHFIILYTSCCFRSKAETANWFLHFFRQTARIVFNCYHFDIKHTDGFAWFSSATHPNYYYLRHKNFLKLFFLNFVKGKWFNEEARMHSLYLYTYIKKQKQHSFFFSSFLL